MKRSKLPRAASSEAGGLDVCLLIHFCATEGLIHVEDKRWGVAHTPNPGLGSLLLHLPASGLVCLIHDLAAIGSLMVLRFTRNCGFD